MEEFWDILKESVTITLVVVGLMAFIELFNYWDQGRFTGRFRASALGQVAVGSVLGVVPGCVGGFISVSMYSQRTLSFAGLLAMAIATTGDESFVMLAKYPKVALCIFAGLFVLAFIVGAISSRSKRLAPEVASLEPVHAHDGNLKERMLHLLPHAGKIFAWTFGIMLIVFFAKNYVDLKSWLGDNTALLILFAVLIGMIPQSGPHMAFVLFFAEGLIPLPVLVANCIMQDGHAGLPLLAASRKDFFLLKGIKSVIALAVGYIWLLFL